MAEWVPVEGVAFLELVLEDGIDLEFYVPVVFLQALFGFCAEYFVHGFSEFFDFRVDVLGVLENGLFEGKFRRFVLPSLSKLKPAFGLNLTAVSSFFSALLLLLSCP